MKKIIIGIIIVVILVGGIYFMSRQAKVPGENNIAMIQSAYLGTESVACDFIDPEYEYKDDERFILYIKAGKMRFSVESTGDLEGNIIIKDGLYYFWTEEGGIKMTLAQTEKEGFFAPLKVENGEIIISDSQDFRFSCRKQAVDDSLFEVPVNIEFMEMDQIITNGEASPDNFDWDSEMFEGVEDLEGSDLPEM